MFVAQVGRAALSHLVALDLLQPFLVCHDLKELVALSNLSILNAGIVVCKLLLTRYMEFVELLFMSLLLCLFVGLVLELSLLVVFLGTDLVKLGLTVLGTLLELSEALSLLLLFFLNAEGFSDLSLFSILLGLLVSSDLHVNFFLGLLGSILLFEGSSVGELDLLLHDLHALLLGCKCISILLLDLFDVCKELGLLLLTDLLLLHAVLLTRRNLIDKNLGAALLSIGSAFLTLKLGLDCLEALDFHHHVESLLLLDPVLLEDLVLVELPLADGPDFRGQHHLVHVLHIVVVFVHLLLSALKKCVLSKGLDLHLKRCSCLPLAVLPLHALLACNRNCHGLLALLLLNTTLRQDLGLVLYNSSAPDPVKIVLADDADHRLVLLVATDLLTDLLQLGRGDDGSVGALRHTVVLVRIYVLGANTHISVRTCQNALIANICGNRKAP